jgi:hypothetical protein
MNTSEVISYFGSAKQAAKALGITKQAVSAWGASVPIGRAFQIEILSNGALKAPRPDQDQGRAA